MQTARRLKTYTNAAAMAITNAIKTSVATSTSVQTYITAALNGSIGAGAIDYPQSFTATTSASVGAYLIGTALTITGTNQQGAVVIGTVTLTATGGGETIHAVDTNGNLVGFASITSIAVPVMSNTAGAFTFGVGHVVLDGLTFDLRAGSAGNILTGYAVGTTTVNETSPAELGEHYYASARIVYSTSTAYPLTIAI